jgi:hypothetical protein
MSSEPITPIQTPVNDVIIRVPGAPNRPRRRNVTIQHGVRNTRRRLDFSETEIEQPFMQQWIMSKISPAA